MSVPFAARDQFIAEIHDVLARLRMARELDYVAEVMVTERRLNWLIDQLRPTN